jgi:hypothetical protein
LVRDIRVYETSFNESEEAPTTAIDLEAARPSIDFPTYFSTTHKAYAGFAMDHNWHLSMVAFILGALPQAIKVFGMSCIPGTQACTAVLLAAFMVPEMFRVVAGPADTFDLEHMPIVDLHRMPHVERAKYATANDKRFGIYFAMVVTLITDLACFLQGWPFEKLYLVAASSSSAFVATCYSFGITYLCRTHRSRLIADDPEAPRSVLANDSGYLQRDEGIDSHNPSGSRLSKCISEILLPLTICIAKIFALRSDIAKILCAPILLYTILCTVLMIVGHVYTYMTAVDQYALGLRPLFPFITFLGIPFVVHQLVFAGSLSHYPRLVFGLQGNVKEFLTGLGVQINILAILGIYTRLYSSEGTSKPRWADALG